MKDAQPRAVNLRDYRAPDYWIDKTDLHFYLTEEWAEVTASLALRRNGDSPATAPLVLHGQAMELLEVAVDGRTLAAGQYQLSDEQLTVEALPAVFTLRCKTRLKPQENTALEGLYKSQSMFCTQCEAEGFRRITYYLDRPDVMSEFTTTVEADKSRYPVLLSNGNPVARGDAGGGRHWVKWHDPFKKPAYLFALVAGDLVSVDDSFTTCSGRQVSLRIFVASKDVDKCDHAMRSLKKAMRWDEEVYGREYDLDIFMIVAVDDFNMGAMENKGLNIFNTSCVLAKPETTTDSDFQHVEGVVAHEYFHNWSGNRVTCRDWFQLSLKEGFTVFRDAEFSADMGSRTVKRVEDVLFLRTQQFAEDAGPMAHPVQPASYIEISNFYTRTIYEKGAEVVRMIHNLLGAQQFRRGSDLYFERHDGQAVTIDDFVAAMEAVSGRDLSQFKRWYSQAGTPRIEASGSYDSERQRFTLNVAQSCPPTPDGDAKLPFHIPLALGLVGEEGSLPLRLQGAAADGDSSGDTTCVLELTEPAHTFVFEQVREKPVPSLLRGFSAPVRLYYDYSRDDLMRLISRDSDGFCRWDASQQLGLAVIEDLMATYNRQGDLRGAAVDTRLIEAYRAVLANASLDQAMVALMLTLPSESYLSEVAERIDVEAIHAARGHLRKVIAAELATELERVYRDNCSGAPYSPQAAAIAQRSLKNMALNYLCALAEERGLALCRQQFRRGDNMTDVLAALDNLVRAEPETLGQAALDSFYQQWRHEPLVINEWLSVQAACPAPGGLARVKALLQHPGFDIKNPNKVRALIGAFCRQNAINFHLKSGAGYRFLADQIIVLNRLNPQIAARMLTPLTRWQKYDEERQALMRSELERIMLEPELSKDVYEVVSKSLVAN